MDVPKRPRKLTQRQQEIMKYLSEYQDKFDCPPSLWEMCAHFGWRSDNASRGHLKALARKGLIELRGGRSRGIRLLNRHPERGAGDVWTGIPVVGRIAAGVPIDAPETIDRYLKVDPNFFSNREVFGLEIKGDSMIEAGIAEGDVAILQKQSLADDGDIIAAYFDGEATLKTYSRKGNHVTLTPANQRYRDIPVELEHSPDFRILGKLVGLVRKYPN
ncbi:MAG: transcriptional repressor LexA [Planctomycetota bacterium]